jgi:hypothetical protein
LEPFVSGQFDRRLELRRHSLRTLHDPYFETYCRNGDLDRYVDVIACFLRAAFEQSLWALLESDRAVGEHEAIAAAFGEELRSRIAAAPDRAACRWHVAILDNAAQ